MKPASASVTAHTEASDDGKVLFAGSGEMATLCRAFDWSSTPLGPVPSWPRSLRTAIGIVLGSRNPMFLWWGPQLIQFYNDAYRPSFGEKGRHPRALGMAGEDCWTDIWPVISPQIEQVMSGGEATWHEDQYLPIERNGRLEDVWWTYSYSPVIEENGSVGGVLVVCLETTRRVLTERERERLMKDTERAELRAVRILEQVSDEHLTMDSEFRILSVNLAAQRALGMSEEALVGRTHWDAFPASVGSLAERHYRRVVAERTDIHFTHHYVGEGYDRHLEIDAYSTDEGGVALFWRDVSERVNSEIALRESEAKYRSLFESIDEGLAVIEMIFDPDNKATDYRFLETNGAFEKQSGLVDAVGKRMRELIPMHEAHWFDMYGRVAVTGEPIRFDGSAEAIGRWYDGYAFRVGRPEERKVAVLFTDVTAVHAARRERERLLRESELARAEAEAARAESEAANRAKGEFLAVMSHELRTPLNAIGGYAELMEMGIRGAVTSEQAEDLRRIQMSQRHLLGLINEVLNYARLETGTVHYDLTDVRVSEALASAEALVAPQAAAKRLILTVADCSPDLVARADTEKLRQVLANILSNAVKFTDPGGNISVSCASVNEQVLIRIRDTGMGIPPEKLRAIFDPFVQVRSDLTRPHEGTGLGLAISRDLARGMGGDLTVESALGLGSSFILALPLVPELASAG